MAIFLSSALFHASIFSPLTHSLAHEYGTGWAGAMRGIFGQIRATSAVEWAVYDLGLGRSPLGP